MNRLNDHTEVPPQSYNIKYKRNKFTNQIPYRAINYRHVLWEFSKEFLRNVGNHLLK